MSVIVKQSKFDQEQSRLIGKQLVAKEQQSLKLHIFKVAVVWAVLFAFLGLLLYLLQIDLPYIVEHRNFVLAGLWTTLSVSLISILAATILAFLGALGRLSTNAIAQGISGFYISLLRGTPLLVQIYIIYSGLPQIGTQISSLGYPTLGKLLILSPIQSGILALSLNYGAYMTEIFRSGIQAISQGQGEAARALGMTHWQTMRLVILPQAFRIVIPPIGNQFIAMQKDSALVSLMGVWEITYRANRFARKDSKFMEMFLLAAAVYWVLTLISEWLQGRLENYMAQNNKR
ncbi:MAG: amino acid ABC transporter permease [Chloroflexi bacterium]|nr:amino acid ABC transporter permease [Chloroflexota bacterium]